MAIEVNRLYLAEQRFPS